MKKNILHLLGWIAFHSFIWGALITATITPAQAAFSNFTLDYTSARMSFRGALAPGNTINSSLITIQTTPAPGVYSLSSQHLVPADLLQIGESYYYVATNSAITVPSEVTLDRPLSATDSATGTPVLMRQLNTLTFSVTTNQPVPDGSFQILVPAASGSAWAADNLPDPNGFDFATSYVTCPTSIPDVFDFTAPTASPAGTSGVQSNGRHFHVYTCPYTGSGAAGTDFSANPFLVHDLVNPAPSLEHETGMIDVSQIVFRQQAGNGMTQDSITGQIGFFEPVKITVEVAPQLSFQINGVPAQTTACGVLTDTSTFARDVPFEDISPLFFKNAAQRLTVSTNASHGYAVTAIADDQMGYYGEPCPGQDAIGNVWCIPDVTANGATPLTPGIWIDPLTQKGFGYTLQNLTTTGNPTVFDFSQGYRQFADRSFPEYPVPIMRNLTVANNDEVFICYRIVPPADTEPGEYESRIMYTITATF